MQEALQKRRCPAENALGVHSRGCGEDFYKALMRRRQVKVATILTFYRIKFYYFKFTSAEVLIKQPPPPPPPPPLFPLLPLPDNPPRTGHTQFGLLVLLALTIWPLPTSIPQKWSISAVQVVEDIY